MFYKQIILLIAFFICCNFAFAQQFSGTPSRIRWRQINTDTVKIIYPEGLDSIAQRIALLTRTEQQKYAGTIGSDVHKINIVLRNELTYFNGYVGLGPYRSEYYLLPQQNAFELGAQSAADLLAVHEYRHVEQYSNFRKGLSKTAFVLFGENGQALANNAAVPNWFFEGDAVYNETQLSAQGRGRLPYFFKGYQALYYAGKQYSFAKLRNGSFKDFVPDHYPLGYMLVAYGRQKYGDDIWQKITNDAVRFKPLIYPWQGAVKKYTGVAYKSFVNDAFHFYQNQWQATKAPVVSWITQSEKNNVVNYQYPYTDSTNNIIVLKNSYKKIAQFYKIDRDGKQEKIAAQSITNDDYFSYNNNKIIYAAYQPDARWSYREYNVLKVLDVVTKKEKTITAHTRYFSPDISHDGRTIAAVAVLPNQHSSLDIVSADGKKLFSLTNNKNEVYSYPKFAADDKSVFVMLRTTNGQMSLQQFNLLTKNTTVLLAFSNKILGYPSVHGDTLFYTATGDRSDEICAYLSKENKHYRVATYPTGLYGAASVNGNIVSATFTANGYMLGNYKPIWSEINDADTLQNLYVQSTFKDAKSIVDTQPSLYQFATSKYHKLGNPFNLHSWQPDYSDPVFTFTVYGENVLNTFQSQFYYAYNTNEKYNEAGANLIYGGWYIQPFINGDKTFGRKQFNTTINDYVTFNETNAGAGLQLPLTLSGGKAYRYLTTSVSYNIKNVQFTGANKSSFSNNIHQTIEGSIRFTSQQQQALQQIYPHWAQSLLVQYRTLAEREKAYQFLVSGSLYLPGILASHSIVLSAAYQLTDTLSNYRFSSDFPFSRGYGLFEDRVYPTTVKLGINYHFPLFYPDFGVGNIVYFRRIRANIFFDYSQLRAKNTKLYNSPVNFKSTGAELYFDTRWWNQQNITVGLRYSRLLDTKYIAQPNQWTIILPQSIFY